MEPHIQRRSKRRGRFRRATVNYEIRSRPWGHQYRKENKVKLKRFYRPEDISAEKAYASHMQEGSESKIQREMILAFLSCADYFQPRYFLLENVRSFVSINEGQTFQLTLASLLEMGYQVRFEILEAGAYGVSQSRKRAFNWAASLEEVLPEWPEPMHVFATPKLNISLSKGLHYAAVRSIGDIPPVENGESETNKEYGDDLVSWFQKEIRGNMIALTDHICEEMKELNPIRCKRIPKRPGADWRDLPAEKVKLSNGQIEDLACLKNKAKTKNEWNGLYGRLDWQGNFPTSITNTQPSGKSGYVHRPREHHMCSQGK